MVATNFNYTGNTPKPEARKAQISVPLDVPDVRVLKTNINNKGEIIITVESTLEGCECRYCGRKIKDFHQNEEMITIRHLAILGRPTYIRLKPKRYNCVKCARRKGKKKVTTTQQLSWQKAKSPNSVPYEEHVLLQLVNSTIKDVSIKAGVGYDGVEGIVERNISIKVDWEQFEKLGVLGIDEIALRKGHQDYVVIITTRLEDGSIKILTILPNRKKKTVKKFLNTIPKRLQETIHTICLDMWSPYILAAEEVFGNKVDLTVDRYHVAKNYRKAADKLRIKELRRLKKELAEAEYKQLKGVMWVFRKNKVDLSPDDLNLLERLFTYSPELKKAYYLREELTTIFEQPLSKQEASKEIKAWTKKVQDSSLTCFDSFLTTLDNHFDYIINYFIKRLNSGFVEGFNNKIKVIKRRCYGILNINHLFQRIFLDLEGYRLFTSVA
jgi:transposase